MTNKGRKESRKTISAIIGTKLKELRNSSDLSLDELATNIDVSKSMISYIETAKRLPSVRVIRIYANFFNVDVLELLDLREATIFETVALLGEDAPLAIRNERNMIAHSYMREDRNSVHGFDLVEDSPVPYVMKETRAPNLKLESPEARASRSAQSRSRRAEEKAKIERSIYEVDETEVTEEEFQVAIEAIRNFRLQND